ncbi:hypothetical protein FJZ19_02895 [Candidatus Pacearchaeota archaeon]|nr:hypothetical protein [Candidatus Pacearchaeota archaeon]
MKNKKLEIAVIILVIILAIAGIAVYNYKITGNAVKTKQTSPAVPITYNNIAQVLSSSDLVGALPEGGSILLRFYNYNSGSRQWEKSFIIKKRSVKEGIEDADIILSLHSKYLSGLTTGNFCSMINIAKKNGDLGFETSLSTLSLAWKYKSMYKFRDCLGF